MRRQTVKLKEAAQALYAKQSDEAEMLAAGLLPGDYETDAVEVWPENQAAFTLFCKLGSQWRVGMNGPTGLDYTPLLALMDRMKLLDADHDDLFDDVQTLERAALTTMNQKD